MNIKSYLRDICTACNIEQSSLQLPDCEMDPTQIKAIMINEVPPKHPDDYFYSQAENPDYLKTTLPLFRNAGVNVHSMNDILNLGIYITTAVKSPKSGYTVESDLIRSHLPILKAELDLFPNVKAIMLMGDVAKKAVNMLHKAEKKKNVIPAESTYKIRANAYFWDQIRVFPSYIMTGGNILIEKSKCTMISDDIKRMMEWVEE